MGCNCGGTKAAPAGFVVRIPGRPDQRVTSEAEAQTAVRGIRGATYRAVR